MKQLASTISTESLMKNNIRITSRNARFQQLQAILSNRAKRQRAGEFIVQGVRPISMAIEYKWPIRHLIYNADTTLSSWAKTVLAEVNTERIGMSAELIRELGEKEDQAPELIAVASMRPDNLSQINVDPSFLGLAFDRPTNPGNIGSIIRSADAFGGHVAIVSGHAADPYDPKSVRGSTGSLFAVPTVRVPSHREVIHWISEICAGGVPIAIVGTDEKADMDITSYDFRQPTLIVVGNETSGMSAGWRDACDYTITIPMKGSASSLNAANAASIVLYEAARQRNQIVN